MMLSVLNYLTLNVTQKLQGIVMSNIVQGPCGIINLDSPCIKHGRCSKKYPKLFVQETQLEADRYPLYHEP